MKMQWPFLNRRNLLGVSFGPKQVVLTLVRRGVPARQSSAVRVPVAASLLKSDPLAAGKEIHNHLQEAGFSGRRCVVCVPLSWLFTSEIDLPDLSGSDLDSMIRMEAEKRFPLAPEDMATSVSRAYTGGGGSRRVLAGLPTEYLSCLQKALRAARLRLGVVTTSAAALAEYHSSDHAAIFLMFEGCVELVLVNKDHPPIFRSLAWLENSAAIDIQEVSRQFRITLAQVPVERRRLVKKAYFYPDANASEDQQRLLESAISAMGLEFQAADVSHESPALHLATAAVFNGQKPLLDLAPPKQKGRGKSISARITGRTARLAAGAAAALLLLLAGAFTLQARQLAQLESQWAAISPRVTQANDLQERLKKYRSWYEDSAPSLELLKKVTEAFPDEGSVWLKSLRVKNRAVATCSGSASSRQEWMRVMEALGSDKAIEDLQVVQARGDGPFAFSITFTWKEKGAGGS